MSTTPDGERERRTCLDCGRTIVLDALRPGWTPDAHRGGWICPDCSRSRRA